MTIIHGMGAWTAKTAMATQQNTAAACATQATVKEKSQAMASPTPYQYSSGRCSLLVYIYDFQSDYGSNTYYSTGQDPMHSGGLAHGCGNYEEGIRIQSLRRDSDLMPLRGVQLASLHP